MTTTELLNLGALYPSDFLGDGEEPRSEPWELRLVMDDDSGLVHLASQPPPELLWGERYWYRSGTNASMLRALRDVVDGVARWTGVSCGDATDVWVDIACNDGTLLAQVLGYARVGIDPVGGEIADEALHNIRGHFINAPFSWAAWQDSPWAGEQAKVITCVAMFYDLMDPTEFLADVTKLLAPDGLFVLQMSYTPLMLRQLAFDNICHEHARYYTLTTLHETLEQAGLDILDVELNDVNGGSFRVYCKHSATDWRAFGSAPQRDVGHMRFDALAAAEDGMNGPAVWWEFGERLLTLRSQVRSFVADRITEGFNVWGYGASTKGNTLLQYFGLDWRTVTAIADAQPQKHGLRTVGSDIPIVSDEAMRAAQPDYLLVLPWHFIDGFRRREHEYLAAGGRFIVPCPRFEVIGS